MATTILTRNNRLIAETLAENSSQHHIITAMADTLGLEGDARNSFYAAAKLEQAVVVPPTLDADKAYVLTTSQKTERRIVANLIAQLGARGFPVRSIDDRESFTRVHNVREAMELIFNLDEAVVYFGKSKEESHGVLLVVGNGEDIISDWNYSADDKDGFNAAMTAFDPYAYA